MLNFLTRQSKVLSWNTLSIQNTQTKRSLSMKLAYDLYTPTGDRERNLPPVMMMHGMLDSRKTWKYIAPQIAERTGRKVYAVDARNHGDSPWTDDITFDLNAEDLSEFLNQHHIPRAAIIGHSMGGRTAVGLALNKPEMVEKIVVEDMNLRNFRPDQSGLLVQIIETMKESLDHIPPAADERMAKRAVAKYIASLFSQSTDTQVPKTNKTKGYDLSMLPLTRRGSSYAWKTNLDLLTNMLTSEKIRQNLEGVFTGDALFIYGTNSFFKVGKDPQIPKLFPRSTLLGIERATHLLHIEFPDRFVDEVSVFLNSGMKAKY